MKIRQKIQFIASAVVAQGAVALVLMSPNSALATTCNPYALCSPLTICEEYYATICTGNAPPGCVDSSAKCLPDPLGSLCHLGSGYGEIQCSYVAG